MHKQLNLLVLVISSYDFLSDKIVSSTAQKCISAFSNTILHFVLGVVLGNINNLHSSGRGCPAIVGCKH